MFLRNYWYVAATADEIGRALMPRWILGEPVVLYRTEAGKPVALLDVCPHRSLPLSRGEIEGDRVRCGYHGLEFEPGGKCVRIPSQAAIPLRWQVKSFPIVEKWRWLWIWMGNPEAADETLIPDMHWNDDPDWTYTGGHFPIGCDYRLLVDNLLDLSHLAFVHRTTIGNDAVAENPVETSVDGNTVTLVRLMPNCPAPPLYVKMCGFTDRIDRSQHIEFRPPSTVTIASRSVPCGSNDGAGGIEYRVLNGITPATDRSCHHFWSVSRNFAPGPEVTKTFRDGSVVAFREDIVILEAQQAMIEARGNAITWLNFNVDAGSIAARKIIETLARQETAMF
jgi:phenylpropionate dioxygenase-like ring-hydroxylating dioxygenase large terminal subunit